MAKIERDYPIARLEGDVERICNEINVDKDQTKNFCDSVAALMSN